MSKTILVVAAHADDEALGCGGTLARHAAEGDTVHVVFVADGVTAREGAEPADLQHRQQATENARRILGISTVICLNLPDNRLDSLPLLDVVQPLEAVIGKVEPQIIYTHHYGDLNVDHRIVHQAVMTACRPMPGGSVREILTFEVMSSTEWSSPGLAPFLPNFFVDVSAHMEVKMQALEAYMREMRAPPHSRSLDHMRCLAEHHGFCTGSAAAEAFMAMRVLR
ncbi:PIG-L deacetylase family protein [Herbaspirillum robiniae]|uniref:GlcNAc-PI de-N-acetylase n=1 Tax=Herbaspirillum robiniae TaxID=2014887 RepID=A0A246WLT6_9BURK|nr:PIG-L deacetylase family protein [Herbaspirillum robiniae]OWY27300.1 GlcNAc-PI de-N-acetylase [Herbaspirillum robiniae]